MLTALFIITTWLLASTLHAQAAFDFIGISSPIPADSGVLAMTAKCQIEFPARKARMCKTTEIADSLNLPAIGAYNSTQGWVRTVPAGTTGFFFPGPNVPVLMYLDAAAQPLLTNYFSDLEPTCFGWSSAGPTFSAYVVGSKIGSSEGVFRREPCSSSNTGVACCGPQS